MPSRNQSGAPEHKMQNPDRKRIKSGDKYKHAIKRRQMLCKREKIEWSTKWIQVTKQRALARMHKYGLQPEKYNV